MNKIIKSAFWQYSKTLFTTLKRFGCQKYKTSAFTYCMHFSMETSAFASRHRISLVLQLRTQKFFNRLLAVFEWYGCSPYNEQQISVSHNQMYCNILLGIASRQKMLKNHLYFSLLIRFCCGTSLFKINKK